MQKHLHANVVQRNFLTTSSFINIFKIIIRKKSKNLQTKSQQSQFLHFFLHQKRNSQNLYQTKSSYQHFFFTSKTKSITITIAKFTFFATFASSNESILIFTSFINFAKSIFDISFFFYFICHISIDIKKNVFIICNIKKVNILNRNNFTFNHCIKVFAFFNCDIQNSIKKNEKCINCLFVYFVVYFFSNVNIKTSKIIFYYRWFVRNVCRKTHEIEFITHQKTRIFFKRFLFSLNQHYVLFQICNQSFQID